MVDLPTFTIKKSTKCRFKCTIPMDPMVMTRQLGWILRWICRSSRAACWQPCDPLCHKCGHRNMKMLGFPLLGEMFCGLKIGWNNMVIQQFKHIDMNYISYTPGNLICSPLKIGNPKKERIIFQAFFFQGAMLNFDKFRGCTQHPKTRKMERSCFTKDNQWWMMDNSLASMCFFQLL